MVGYFVVGSDVLQVESQFRGDAIEQLSIGQYDAIVEENQ